MAPAADAGPHQLPEKAIHRFAIGDPERISHELFAELRIGMVNGGNRAARALFAGPRRVRSGRLRLLSLA